MTSVLERPTAPAAAAQRGPWAGFAVILAEMIMNLLDSTIVTIAAPAIQRDLGASASALEWVAAAYTLAIAVGLMTGGRLGDIFGRKRMLLLGIGGVVAASALCALAWSPESLIAARVLQGAAAAMLIPQTFGLIRDIFGPDQVGKAFAAFGPCIGLSTVLGPVVAHVRELEPLGQGVVELQRAELPGALQRVLDMELELRPVERPLARRELERDTRLLERPLEPALGLVPQQFLIVV